jgi:hypothetical protein
MPRRWVRIGDAYVAPGVHGSGLAPRLEHRSEPWRGSLDGWAARMGGADRGRPGFDLEDEDVFELGGHEVAYRRFGHELDGVPVLSDQWLWVVEGAAHQLVGSVAADEYADYCDVFESVAETFDPHADPRSRSA